MRRIACVFACVVAAAAARATDYTWTGTPANYTSPRGAASWSTTNLWGSLSYPNGSDDTAKFTQSAGTVFFIKEGNPISLKQCQAANVSYLSYVSDARVTVYGYQVTTRFPWLYAPLSVAASAHPYWNSMRFCADVDLPADRSFLFHGTAISHLHYDRYATDAGAVREIPAWKGTARTYNITLNFYGPESSTTNVVNTFGQASGSPYLQRATGQTGALSVGTFVTGRGIPEGTYLKRVFPKRGWIELSKSATETIAANTLTFAAFTPKVHHQIAKLEPNGSVCRLGLSAGKYAAEDELVIDLDYLVLYPWGKYTPSSGAVLTSDRAVVFGLSGADDGDAPRYPGRFVIHQVPTTKDTNVQLETCDVLLSSTPSATMVPGLPYSVVRVPTATAEAQVAVTGAMTAVIGEIQNLKGALVKTGTGTLFAGFTTNQVANTGRLVVNEGLFAIADPDECDCKAADDRPIVGALEIGANGTLRLPARGLRVTGEVTSSAGAFIDGPGTLSCAQIPHLTGARVNTNVTIVIDRLDTQIVDPPAAATATTLPGDPAFWVDCSQTNKMMLVPLATAKMGSTLGVYRIDDVRKTSDGDKYLFSTNCTGNDASTSYLPVLQYDKSKDLYHVYFQGGCGTPLGSIFKTDAHAWSRPVAEIKVVFEVYGADGTDADGGTGGSMPFLGGTSLARCQTVVPTGKTALSLSAWCRYNSGKTCFFSWPTTGMTNGEFRVNGKLTVPGPQATGDYPPYGSPLRVDSSGQDQRYCYRCYPMVTDLTIVPEANKTYVSDAYTFYADSTGMSGQRCVATEKKRLFELIVYTNALTKSEKISVRRYLMRKWLGQDGSVSMHEMNPVRMGDVDGTIVVQEGDSILAEGMVENARFTKQGAGTIAVEDVVAPEAEVTVSTGALKLRSFNLSHPPTNDEDRVRLHLDASEVDSRHFDLGTDAERGVRTVLKWKDQKPTDKIDFTPWQRESENLPFIVEDKLNGHAVVDFGSFLDVGHKVNVEDTCPALIAPRQYGSHAVIAIWGSERGGGSLLGQYQDNCNLLGLCRNEPTYGAVASDPIICPMTGGSDPYANTNSYASRLNGLEVNPMTTGLTGTFDLFSHVMWAPIGFEALQINDNDSRRWMGGGQLGEILVLDIGPAAPHMDEIEAYFRKKWFDVDTDGFHEASIRSLTVAPGASLEVTGGGPLNVKTLSIAGGAVKGDLVLTEEAELTVTVNADGSITPVAVDGSVDLLAGGTVKLVGATDKIARGEHVLISGVGDTSAENWTVDTSPLRKRYQRHVSVYVKEGNLCLRLTITGLIVTIEDVEE